MKKILIAVLALSILSVAAIVSADDDAPYTIDPQKHYTFTGYFKQIKISRDIDVVILAGNNANRNIFVSKVSALKGKASHISRPMMACIGDPDNLYDGQVEVVSSLSHITNDWLSLRLRDATCKHLPLD
jgi:hypothetical protein